MSKKTKIKAFSSTRKEPSLEEEREQRSPGNGNLILTISIVDILMSPRSKGRESSPLTKSSSRYPRYCFPFSKKIRYEDTQGGSQILSLKKSHSLLKTQSKSLSSKHTHSKVRFFIFLYQLETMLRTHHCSALTKSHLGQQVVLT